MSSIIITTTPPSSSSSSQCEAFNQTILRTEAVVFWNTRPIFRSHNWYRFGRTNNITVAIVPTSSTDRRNYLAGLLSLAIFMFSVIALWLLVLLAFRCYPNKLGFLSGRRVALPPRPIPPKRNKDEEDEEEIVFDKDDTHESFESITDDPQQQRPLMEEDMDMDENYADPTSTDEPAPVRNVSSLPVPNSVEMSQLKDESSTSTNVAPNNPSPLLQKNLSERQLSSSDSWTKYGKELDDWKKLVKIRKLRLDRIRIAVLVSGAVIVLMAVLLIVYGVQHLSDAVSDSLNSIDAALALCDIALVLLNSFLQFRSDTINVTEQAIQTTNYTICPDVERVVCGVLPCTNDLDEIISSLSQSNVVYDSVTSIRNDVLRIQSILTTVETTIVGFNWAFWVAASAVLLVAVCTLILMNSVILSWRRQQLEGCCWYRWTTRFRGWVVVPIFVILLLIGWISSMVFVIGSMASADFCYNSPDQNVQAVLGTMQDQFSSILYPLMVYYVSGCPGVNVVQSEVLPLAKTIFRLATRADTFVNNLEAATPQIAAVCGTDPSSLIFLLSEVSDLLCFTAQIVLDTINFFTCSNWNGLYASVMYTAVCYNGNTGFGWIAISQSVILVCSLIFLTLRVAFYEVVDESELQPPPGACRRCLKNSCSVICCFRRRCTYRGEKTTLVIDEDTPVNGALDVTTESLDNKSNSSTMLPSSSKGNSAVKGHCGTVQSRSLYTGSLSSGSS